MTWWTSGTNQTAANAVHAEIVLFAELDFSSGVVRAHTRTGTINWGGNDWLGVGKFGSIELVRDDAELRPFATRLSLSGVDASFITTAVTEDYHGRAVSVYVGLLDTATFALVATPEKLFGGIMDYMTVSLAENSGQIVVNCESELARWTRPRGLLFTHESQQLLYAGDKGLNQVAFIQSKVVTWDKKVSVPSLFDGGGGGRGDTTYGEQQN